MMVELVYEAPAECPGRSDLEAQLRARVPAEWTSGADGRRFAVRIVRDESGGFSGRLEVQAAGREPSVREIHADTCGAVSTAVAVFIAIALDPSTAEPPRIAAPAPDARDAASEASPRSETSRPPSSSRASWVWSAGFQARYLGASAPAWGGRVHAELARAPAKGAIGEALRVSWGWSDFALSAERAGEAKFRLRTARVEGCARIPLASFVVAPCAALDVGSLAAASPELPHAGHATARWTAAGGTLRAAWSIGSWLSLEAEAGLLVPFERMTFVLVDPVREVYRPPGVLLDMGAGIGVSARLP